MKKWIAVLLAVCALALAGCAGAPAGGGAIEIGPVELNEREQELVNVLGAANDGKAIFEYTADQTVEWITTWLEVYEDGVLQSAPMEGKESIGDSGKVSGLIAVVPYSINAADSKWSVSTSYKGKDGASNSNSTTDFQIADRPLVASSNTKLDEVVEAKPGEEIILAAYYYGVEGDTAFDMYSPRDIQKDPAVLQGAAQYVVLLKCMFEEV